MTNDNTPAPPHDENHIIAERRAKLTALREKGQAFPNDFRREHLAADLAAAYGDKTKEELDALNVTVTIAGRMMLKRVMGGASFATVQDMSGRIQLYINDAGVGADVHEAFKHWDMGDILGATGTMFKTQKGELSIKVKTLRLLTKSLRPLPEKFHGLTDTEMKYRQRYVDLIMNPESRRTFEIRSKMIAFIRNFYVQRGYLEVETPMMHTIPGGAAAKPFITHYNALDQQMYMRIAPELYLKRLTVGGFEKVFEINRNYRNEGTSTRHNPEFTMLEFYEAYQDYNYLMDLTETLFRECAQAVLGSTTIKFGELDIDLGKPFDRLTMAQAIMKYNPHYTEAELNDMQFLRNAVKRSGTEVRASDGLGVLQLKLFEANTEEKLIQPTYIMAHPTDVSPLARANDTNPDVTDRFELFITGREICNGFSELNDPEDQAARFHAQTKAKDAGDEEAMFYDADYIKALEYGLPPTAGEGIGIDRLVMLFTNSPAIRDVILFPQLRKVD